MALSSFDRDLLARCLAREHDSWEDFVRRFLGLVVHVVNHSAQARSIRLTNEDREDLVHEVFLAVLRDNFAVLRQFRGESSLATYLTVVARRVVVHELIGRKNPASLGSVPQEVQSTARNGHGDRVQQLQDRDEIERLLEELEGTEAEVVRLYHLEGKSYQEISAAVGMPENSIGPTLSRARQKMRKAGVE